MFLEPVILYLGANFGKRNSEYEERGRNYVCEKVHRGDICKNKVMKQTKSISNINVH